MKYIALISKPWGVEFGMYVFKALFFARPADERYYTIFTRVNSEPELETICYLWCHAVKI